MVNLLREGSLTLAASYAAQVEDDLVPILRLYVDADTIIAYSELLEAIQ